MSFLNRRNTIQQFQSNRNINGFLKDMNNWKLKRDQKLKTLKI